MYKLIEIEGRWVQVSYKTIKINGETVITESESKVLDINPADYQPNNQQVIEQEQRSDSGTAT